MAIVLSMTVKGDKRTQRNLKRLGDRGPIAVEGGLFEAGERIMGDAKTLTPVDTGALRNSGFVLTTSLRDLGPSASLSVEARGLPKRNPNNVTAVVGFGGPAIRYALVQHERTDFRHTVGQAKYLETAAQQRSADIPRIVAARIDREIRKLG